MMMSNITFVKLAIMKNCISTRLTIVAYPKILTLMQDASSPLYYALYTTHAQKQEYYTLDKSHATLS